MVLTEAVLQRGAVVGQLLEGGKREDGGGDDDGDEPDVYEVARAVVDAAEEALVESPHPHEKLHLCFDRLDLNL